MDISGRYVDIGNGVWLFRPEVVTEVPIPVPLKRDGELIGVAMVRLRNGQVEAYLRSDGNLFNSKLTLPYNYVEIPDDERSGDEGSLQGR